MKSFRILLSVFFFLSYSLVSAQTIDVEKSVVNFHITGGGIFKVKGTFKDMTGDFNFNASDLENSGFKICIDAASINTKNKKRDVHLRDPDFFDVEKYPNICFESRSISQTPSGYVTRGDLTIHGVTKTVEIPFEFKNNTFNGAIVINRFDYDLGKDYGTMRVGTEAKVNIICNVN